jgi:hypothetical protein
MSADFSRSARAATTSSPPALRLEIGQTWDGHPVDSSERASILVRGTGDGLTVEVTAPFHGDPAPPGPPGPCDDLWEHEVVELFLVGTATPGQPVPYLEIELSPHGHYLALRLAGRRRVVQRGLALPYRTSREGERWRGRAWVRAELLPPQPWRVNAYALHGAGSRRRFLAWTPVPGETPDFHRIEYFPPLALPLTGASPRSSR